MYYMSKKYFVRANSYMGQVNRLVSNIRDIDHIYVLLGATPHIRSAFMGRICAHLKERQEKIEYLFSPFSPDYYDGFIVREKSVAVLDNLCIGDDFDKKHIIVDLGECVNGNILDKAEELSSKAYDCFKVVYSIYSKAKKVHDDWEKIYISNMNISRLNCFNAHTTEKILTKKLSEKTGEISERFFGCACDRGYIEYIDSVTKDISKRYFIKGRPGTGKSTFMRRFASKATSLGYDCEVYYCSFDPFSYDMVVVPSLSVCVFDSTSPHIKELSRNSDEILDFYIHSGLEGTDEKFAKELDDVRNKYTDLMSDATQMLKQASLFYKSSDELSSNNLNCEKMNNLVYSFLNEIIR